MPEANKIINILQSQRSFGRGICEIQVNFRCSEITHCYNAWLDSYNSSDERFESTVVMISVVFFYLFVYLFIRLFSISLSITVLLFLF
jgi:hypothetical protein